MKPLLQHMMHLVLIGLLVVPQSIIALTSLEQLINVVEVHKQVAVHGATIIPSTLPASITSTPLALAAGETLQTLIYYALFHTGNLTYVTLSAASLAAINSALTQGVGVTVGCILSSDASSFYQLTFAAYNASTKALIVQETQSVFIWNNETSEQTGNKVPFSNNPLTSAQMLYITSTKPQAAIALQAPAGSPASSYLAITAPAAPAAIPSTLPASITSAAVSLSAGETFTDLIYYVLLKNGNLSYVTVSTPTMTAINTQLSQGTGITMGFTLLPDPTSTFYEVTISAFNASTKALITKETQTVFIWNNETSEQVGKAVPFANNSIWNQSFLYTTSLKPQASVALSAPVGSPATSYATVTPSVAPNAKAILPAVSTLTPAFTLSGGQTLEEFAFAPIFSDNSYTELVVTSANIAALNAVIQTGVPVIIQAVLTPGTTWTATLSAYNATTQAVVFQQAFSPIVNNKSVNVSGTLTLQSGTNITFTRTAGTNGTPAADKSLNVLATGSTNLTQNFLIPASVAPSAKATLPAVSALTPAFTLSGGQTVEEFAFSPIFSDNSFAELVVTSANIAALNAVIQTGVPVIIQVILTQGTPWTATLSAYNATTQAVVFQQAFSSIVNNNSANVSGALTLQSGTNITFTRTAGTNGTPAADQSLNVLATGSTNLTQNFLIPASVAPNAKATLPAVSTLQPVFTLSGGQTVESFSFSPIFSDNSFAELVVTSANIAALNAVIQTGVSVIIQVILTQGTPWTATLNAYNATTQAVVFQQAFSSIVNNNSANVSGALTLQSNTNITFARTAGTNGTPAADKSLNVLATGSTNLTQNFLISVTPVAAGTLSLSTLGALSYSALKTALSAANVPVTEATAQGALTTSDNFSFAFSCPLGAGTGCLGFAIPTTSWPKIGVPNLYTLLNAVSGFNLSTGVTYLMLAFDANNNLITDVTKVANVNSLNFYLFAYDVNGKSLFPSGVAVPVATMGNNFNNVTALSSNQVSVDLNGQPATPGAANYPVSLIITGKPAPKSVSAGNISIASAITSFAIVPNTNVGDLYSYINLSPATIALVNAAIAKGTSLQLAVSVQPNSVTAANYDITITIYDQQGNVVAQQVAQNVTNSATPGVSNTANIASGAPITTPSLFTWYAVSIQLQGFAQAASLNVPAINQTVSLTPGLSAEATLLASLIKAGATVSNLAMTIPSGTNFSSINFNIGGAQGFGYSFGQNAWNQSTQVGPKGVGADISTVLQGLTATQWANGIDFLLLGVDSSNTIITDITKTFPANFVLYMFDSAGNTLSGLPVSVALANASPFSAQTTPTAFTTLAVGIGVASATAVNGGSLNQTYPVVVNVKIA